MNLNDLSDDCLLLIFDKFSDLGSFPKLTKVCKRWKKLVQIRLRKVTCLKYIARHSLSNYCFKIKWYGKCILSNDLVLLESIKLSQFLPNVKKIKFSDTRDEVQNLCSALANLLATGNPITQLIFTCSSIRFSHSCPIIENLLQFIIPYLEDIEHLTTNVNLLVENYFQAYGNHNKLKRLGNRMDLSIDLSHVLNFADSMTNLKLLFINTLYQNREHNRISTYDGPIFEKLESLYIFNGSRLCFVTRILDFCPNLRNLTLILPKCTERIQIDSDIKNDNLQGLFINLDHSYGYDIIPIVEKFPNVRYLRIDGTLTESQLTNIIELLPHLSVLVIDNGLGHSLTIDSFNRVKTFCRSNKLNINFFYQCSCPGLENNELHKKFRNSFKRINVNNKVNNFNQ
ncbi:uncharacterized protein LOC128389483 [Panonychus citri]|uniref:uncharacterized protein LOC128389483 n=1 Tax=Panonychus citri TaxID=50023 RepID=UPI0023073D1B|nr:uncharacterized protein LOC128389483 [Panonychus citri]